MTKRIVIMTYGSRGDVQPYVALGVGLKEAGYDVRVAAPAVFADFVTGYGLDFVPLPGDPAELTRALSDAAGLNIAQTWREIANHMIPLGRDFYRQMQAARDGADAVFYNSFMLVAGHKSAQMLHVPEFFTQMYPMFIPTGEFPSILIPPLPLGAAYNRLSHQILTAVYWGVNRVAYALIRRQVSAQGDDLTPLGRWLFADPNTAPVGLFGWSPQMIPRPADWPSKTHVTGFWALPSNDDWTPPPDLAAFLEAGPPPVYVGFGSVVIEDIMPLTNLVLDALQQAGLRGVLLGGWAGLGNAALPETVFKVESAPHDWLFPRMAAVVHHGGFGTTAAGLTSGVPSILVPFTAEQTYWGRVVRDLGVGPEAIPRRRLTADRLAYALRMAVEHEPMRQRAADLGAKIRAEDGVGAAVRVVREVLGDT